jgi:hypothetical protein
MAVQRVKVTRRSLAGILAAAAVAPRAGASQTSSQAGTAADPDLQAARELMQTNAQLIAKVKLPMATEPACHFKA